MDHRADEVVNIYDAKSGFSKLVSRVEQGEHVTISRHGRPVARLVPLTDAPPQRRPGAWKGRVRISDDFDTFDGADEREWYGS